VNGSRLSCATRDEARRAGPASPFLELHGSGVTQRGAFFRPVKQQITLRLDADIIDWFKRHPKPDAGYRTSINPAPREYVAQHDRD